MPGLHIKSELIVGIFFGGAFLCAFVVGIVAAVFKVFTNLRPTAAADTNNIISTTTSQQPTQQGKKLRKFVPPPKRRVVSDDIEASAAATQGNGNGIGLGLGAVDDESPATSPISPRVAMRQWRESRIPVYIQP